MEPHHAVSAIGLTVLALALGGCTANDPAAAGDGAKAEPVSPPTAAATSPPAPTASPSGVAPTPSPLATIEAFVVADLAVGDQHACALDSDGAAWCWGYDEAGQLGTGGTEDTDRPMRVVADVRFRSLSAGRAFTCGLATVEDGGGTWCWGDGSRGQLGDGRTGAGSDDADRAVPAPVDGGVELASIVTGQLHACGLDDDGALWCWGAYASGQLASSPGADVTRPTAVAPDLTLSSLAPGGDVHGCGLDAAGVAWCWGNDTFGQLGRGERSNAGRDVPAPVVGDARFAALALGARHTCGLDLGGAAWCWGSNARGQLGDGTTEERLVPTPVATDTRFVSLSLGDDHSCGVTSDGRAWCWGSDADGQLGRGDGSGSSPTPVAVAGDVRFAALHAGEEFTCGRAIDGGAWCWGSNRAGWLGTGDWTPSPVPVPVAAP